MQITMIKMIAKNAVKLKMEKGAVNTIVLLVIGVIVFLGLTAVFFKGTASADASFDLPCIFGGGKECEAKQLDQRVKQDATASLQNAIACAYYRCADSLGCGSAIVRTLSWNGGTQNCYRDFCEKLKLDGKVCGEESKENPVTFQPSEAKDSIKLQPIDRTINAIAIQKKCEVGTYSTSASGITNIVVSPITLEEAIVDKNECKEDNAIFTQILGKYTECRLKLGTYYLWAEKKEPSFLERSAGLAKGDIGAVVCSQNPVTATK
ncbi:MAG: hypothetical protein HY361_03680 [Candidatus Aenigmarchaeota archaeon]|nr:hypothetical protein [Candidatus Aenigmarchaeota archaeon]